jgi:hypothetical protein
MTRGEEYKLQGFLFFKFLHSSSHFFCLISKYSAPKVLLIFSHCVPKESIKYIKVSFRRHTQRYFKIVVEKEEQ